MKVEETTCGVTAKQLESLQMKVLRFVRELESIKAPAKGGKGGSMPARISFADKVRRFEKRLIETALVRTNGRQRRAAKLLGVKMSTLHAKIKRYGLSL